MDLRTPADRQEEEFKAGLQWNNTDEEQRHNCCDFILWPSSMGYDLLEATEDWRLTLFDMFGRLGWDGIAVLRDGDMWDALVSLGIFRNKAMAKGSWRKTDKFPDHGLSSFVVKHRVITVWFPPEGLDMRHTS